MKNLAAQYTDNYGNSSHDNTRHLENNLHYFTVSFSIYTKITVFLFIMMVMVTASIMVMVTTTMKMLMTKLTVKSS